MPTPRLKDFLAELGLHKQEVAVFVAALQAGSAPASTIARLAGLERVTTYEILKRLSKKGFMKIRAKEGARIKHFVPEDLGEIKTRLERRVLEMQSSLGRIEEVKKEFATLYRSSTDKPLVLFYEGKEGVRSVLRDSLISQPKEILAMASSEWLSTIFSDDGTLEDYFKERVARKIPCRAIVDRAKETLAYFTKEHNARYLRSLRFIPQHLYDFRNEIDIYNDSVAITSLAKDAEHSVLIRSKSIADSMRSVFNALWSLGSEE